MFMDVGDIGIQAALTAVALGAEVVEKHFTLDKNLPGADHKLSAAPNDLKRMVSEIRDLEKILGSGEIRRLDAENDTVKYRKYSAI